METHGIRTSRRLKPNGIVQIAILNEIRKSPEAAYGIAIAARLARLGDREISDAQTYVSLKRLENAGLISSTVKSTSIPGSGKPPETSGSGRSSRRRYYTLTAAGLRAIEEAKSLFLG